MKEYPVLIQSWFTGIGATVLIPELVPKKVLRWARQQMNHWNDNIHPMPGEILVKKISNDEAYQLFGVIREGKEEDFGRYYTEIRAVLVDKHALLPQEEELKKRVLEIVLNPDRPATIALPCQEGVIETESHQEAKSYSLSTRKNRCKKTILLVLFFLVILGIYDFLKRYKITFFLSHPETYIQVTFKGKEEKINGTIAKEYPNRAKIMIEANTNDKRLVFLSWKGLETKENPYKFEIQENAEITACFEESKAFKDFKKKIDNWTKECELKTIDDIISSLKRGKEYENDSKKFKCYGLEKIQQKIKELEEFFPHQEGSYKKNDFIKKFSIWKAWALFYQENSDSKKTSDILKVNVTIEILPDTDYDQFLQEAFPNEIKNIKTKLTKILPNIVFLSYKPKHKVEFKGNFGDFLQNEKIVLTTESKKNRNEITFFLREFQGNLSDNKNIEKRPFLIESITIKFQEKEEYVYFRNKMLYNQ